MSSRLDRIKDWEVRAEQARFNVTLLAKECEVTVRQLRRYFQAKFGIAPHNWLTQNRLQKVRTLLPSSQLLKEVSANAGFKRPSDLTRQFKRYYKATPSSVRDQACEKPVPSLYPSPPFQQSIERVKALPVVPIEILPSMKDFQGPLRNDL